MNHTYSERMHIRYLETGEGMRISLPKNTVFWSRGFKGCPICEKSCTRHTALYPFRYTKDGETFSGMACHPNYCGLP